MEETEDRVQIQILMTTERKRLDRSFVALLSSTTRSMLRKHTALSKTIYCFRELRSSKKSAWCGNTRGSDGSGLSRSYCDDFDSTFTCNTLMLAVRDETRHTRFLGLSLAPPTALQNCWRSWPLFQCLKKNWTRTAKPRNAAYRQMLVYG